MRPQPRRVERRLRGADDALGEAKGGVVVAQAYRPGGAVAVPGEAGRSRAALGGVAADLDCRRCLSDAELELGHRRQRCAGRAGGYTVSQRVRSALSGPLLAIKFGNMRFKQLMQMCPDEKGHAEEHVYPSLTEDAMWRRSPPYPQIRGVLATEHAP